MPRKQSPYYWLAEPLLDQPSLIEKRMFGCDAFYVFGRLQLVLCEGSEEPWRGVLVATDRAHHAALISEFPALKSHQVLGKWLYISEADDDFEDVVNDVICKILSDDPRIGVEPKQNERKRRRVAKPSGPRSNPQTRGRKRS